MKDCASASFTNAGSNSLFDVVDIKKVLPQPLKGLLYIGWVVNYLDVLNNPFRDEG